MRVYIQVKQLGKRKCCIEKLPSTFLFLPPMCQELIASIVSWQVSEYNDRMHRVKYCNISLGKKLRTRLPPER